MKTANQAILDTVLKTDSTVSDHQRESVVAILNGKTPPTQPLLLNQSQVAQTFGTSRQTVWAMAKNGALHPIKLTSGLLRYRREEVEAIAAKGV